jgi:O-antigen/teichoic acid export membrane protein
MRMSAGVSEMARATALALATTGVGAVVARLDLFVIGAVATSSEAGIFGAAATLALAPTTLGAYLAPVFSARILPYCREQRLKLLLRDVQRGLVALAVAGAAFGVITGPYLIERVLPADYSNVSAVLQILIVAGAAGFVTFPLVLHTLLFLSPRTYLLMDLASIPLLVPAYVIAARQSGAIGVAWVTAISAVSKAAIAQMSATAAVTREQARTTTLQPLSTVVS